MNCKALIISLGILASGCATTKHNPTKEKWNEVLNSKQFQEEKSLYKARMDGLDVCWGTGVDEFLSSNGPQPDSKCLYLSSRISVEKEPDGLFGTKNTVRQFNKLKVLQVTDEGFVVSSPDRNRSQVIFVQKSDEENLVDGAYLDQKGGWGLYRYVGTYRYQSLAGPRTVHSFRKTGKKEFEHIFKDIKVYGAIKEFYIQNELWDYL